MESDTLEGQRPQRQRSKMSRSRSARQILRETHVISSWRVKIIKLILFRDAYDRYIKVLM